MYFFSAFPTVDYTLDGNTLNMVDISRHVKVTDFVKSYNSVFYDYTMKDGERLDVIAYKYYGDASYDWVILMINTIIHPQFGLALNMTAFDNYIKDTYGSLEYAYSTVRNYFVLIDNGTYASVDEATYESTDPTDRYSETIYEYETRLNEDKRTIKLLHKDYINDFVNEFKGQFE